MDRRTSLGLMATGAALVAVGCAASPTAPEREAASPEPGGPRSSPPQPGRSVVILGGGFGGITTALGVRAGLGSEHRVTLVDRRSTFMMGLRKPWLLTGAGTRAEGERPLEALRGKGIDVQRADVTALDIPGRTVSTDGGDLRFDHLVIALGAEPRPDLIPGFNPAAFDLYDVVGVERAAARVASFAKGRVVIAVLGLPFKCPPAPYETAMLLDASFRARGARAGIEIRVVTLQPMTLPAAGKGPSDELQALLTARNIAVELGRKALRIEGSRVVFADGALDADLLLVVPPHRPPKVVQDSGLVTAGDWVGVDGATLRTPHPGVWAIGDVTQIAMANGAPLPKAGVFAESQGRVVAAQIVAEVLGLPATETFDGKGYCFVETGNQEALALQGEFLARPAANVVVEPPSKAGYEKKLAFERDRLARWF